MLDSPGPEHTAVRRAVALTRERLADPLTLADVTARSPVAETPHRT